MLRITLLMFAALAGTWGNAGLLFAQTQVVVAAGSAEEPRTVNQFELVLAAATGIDEQNQAIAGGLVFIHFLSSADGIETISAEVEQVEIFSEEGVPVLAEIACTAEVKLRRGGNYLGVAGAICVSDQRKWSLYFPETMDKPIQEAVVFSGGSGIGFFEPELLVIALGQGSTVPSAAQAAAVIGAEQRAMGRLSLLAYPDRGDVVRVEGVADGAALGFNVGRRRLRLNLAGVAAVDVFRPDGTSPDTCFSDFTFVQNAGPHGPFRLDAPDCRDPLAGIEGSDIGSGCGNVAATAWPPEPDPRPFPGAPGGFPD